MNRHIDYKTIIKLLTDYPIATFGFVKHSTTLNVSNKMKPNNYVEYL
jgi:hypothetical protein